MMTCDEQINQELLMDTSCVHVVVSCVEQLHSAYTHTDKYSNQSNRPNAAGCHPNAVHI